MRRAYAHAALAQPHKHLYSYHEQVINTYCCRSSIRRETQDSDIVVNHCIICKESRPPGFNVMMLDKHIVNNVLHSHERVLSRNHIIPLKLTHQRLFFRLIFELLVRHEQETGLGKGTLRVTIALSLSPSEQWLILL